MGRYINYDRLERLTFGRMERPIPSIRVFVYDSGWGKMVVPDPLNKELVAYFDKALEMKEYLLKHTYYISPQEYSEGSLWASAV